MVGSARPAYSRRPQRGSARRASRPAGSCPTGSSTDRSTGMRMRKARWGRSKRATRRFPKAEGDLKRGADDRAQPRVRRTRARDSQSSISPNPVSAMETSRYRRKGAYPTSGDALRREASCSWARHAPSTSPAGARLPPGGRQRAVGSDQSVVVVSEFGVGLPGAHLPSRGWRPGGVALTDHRVDGRVGGLRDGGAALAREAGAQWDDLLARLITLRHAGDE